MPKLAKPLTDIQPRNAKGGLKPKGFNGRTQDEPTDKPYTLPDGGGLYLLVNPDGSKYWRMQCRFAGKPRLLAFGKYPEVSLAEARDARNNAKKQINAGIDPSQTKRIERVKKASAAASEMNNAFCVKIVSWISLYVFKQPVRETLRERCAHAAPVWASPSR